MGEYKRSEKYDRDGSITLSAKAVVGRDGGRITHNEAEPGRQRTARMGAAVAQ